MVLQHLFLGKQTLVSDHFAKTERVKAKFKCKAGVRFVGGIGQLKGSRSCGNLLHIFQLVGNYFKRQAFNRKALCLTYLLIALQVVLSCMYQL